MANVVTQQHSRKLLKMGILMSETCGVSKKYNKSSKLYLVGFFIRQLSVCISKFCNKLVKMNVWRPLFVHILQKQNLLIKEQNVEGPNALCELTQDAALYN